MTISGLSVMLMLSVDSYNMLQEVVCLLYTLSVIVMN